MDLLLSVVLAAVLGLGALALPAEARERQVTVRLPDGSLRTLRLDLPDGAPLASLGLPGPALAIDGEPVVPGPREGPDERSDRPVEKERTPSERADDRGAGRKPKAKPPRRARRARAAGDRRSGRENRGRGRPERSSGMARPRGQSRPRANLLPPPAPSGFGALPGPTSPDPSLERFRVPPFLLPIYRAAADRYGVPWEVLAAINEIETDYGRNVAVSSAGALGWMQFMPATWREFGLDANNDGHKDPYNPLDAIFSAARYLRASGAERNLRAAIFAYNHADWYVESVLLRARVIGGAPKALVGSLSGLADGRFPVAGKARYPSRANPDRRLIKIATSRGAAVVAADGGVVKEVGRSRRLGRYAVLEDRDGNRYTYAGLGLPSPASRPAEGQASEAPWPGGFALLLGAGRPHLIERLGPFSALFRAPPSVAPRSRPLGSSAVPAPPRPTQPLRRGARIAAGRVLARAGGEVRFAIRPAGGHRLIDPKPILDGWRLLARAGREGTLHDEQANQQGLLRLSTRELERRVLADERIELYPCGRQDVRAHRIDRRVLIALSHLADAGLHPTVSSLQCGHSLYTASGNVSEHSEGSAVDISHLNGVPVLGHQGPGGVTEQAVKELLRLRGAMAPHQVISLLDLGAQSFAMADHADHIHLGFRPGTSRGQAPLPRLDGPGWSELVPRLGEIESPTVGRRPSRFAVGAG